MGLVAVDAEFGLDTEHNPSAIDQLLDLRRPAVVDVGARVFADLVVIDVLVHQDRGLDVRLCRFGGVHRITDHLLGGGRHFQSSEYGL